MTNEKQIDFEALKGILDDVKSKQAQEKKEPDILDTLTSITKKDVEQSKAKKYTPKPKKDTKKKVYKKYHDFVSKKGAKVDITYESETATEKEIEDIVDFIQIKEPINEKGLKKEKK